MRPSNVRIARELGLWRSTDPTPEGAKQLRDLLERLGTTFVKLGQLLATRADLVGELYAAELASLQDNVSPLPASDIENVFLEQFGSRPAAVFEHFDPVPLASASIAQTHRVRLKTGEDGVMKVRRPGIEREVREDLDLLRKLAARIERRVDMARFVQVRGLVDELATNLQQEMDLREDAQNMRTICETLQGFENIVVPGVLGWVSKRTMVMEHIEGVRVDALTEPEVERTAVEIARELERPEDESGEQEQPTREQLASELLRCYLKQITVDGIYHADPHGGNILLTEDGRLALLDFGLIGRLDENTRLDMALLLMAMGENRGEDVADMLLRMSSTTRSSDEQLFAREIRRRLPQYQRPLGQVSVGSAIVSIQRLAIDCRVSLPLPFALIGKTLSQVDSIARTLAPQLDPMQVIRDYTPRLIAQLLQRQARPGTALEGTALPLMAIARIPQRVEHLLGKAERGELKVGIVPTELDEAVGEARTLVNRIAWAIVCSAMIISSAMLMNVEGVGEILGYPALGFIGFVLAFTFGILLLWRMLRTRGGL
jgi:predicted unusual protein kinase regulating ubiquinone biosynthesis (AarF/ABC1/UbiB family)